MARHRLLAFAVMAMWLGQAVNLWPLPAEVAAQMSAGLEGKLPEAVEEMQGWMWLAWIFRIILIPMGIVSGILLLRKSPKWAVIFLACAIVYLLFFRVWQWIPFYLEPLESLSRLADRASWIWKKPGFIFTTLLFPLWLVVVAIFAASWLSRRRHALHAI